MRCLQGRRADFENGMSSAPHVRHDVLRSRVGGLVGRRSPEKREESLRLLGVVVDLAAAVLTSVGASAMVALRLRVGRGVSSTIIVRLRGLGISSTIGL